LIPARTRVSPIDDVGCERVEMTKYTRREIGRLSHNVLGRYHALVVENNLADFEELLSLYQPELSEDTKKELIRQFMQSAENVLRRNWLSQK
jgi:hypothetical protein